MEKTAYRGGIYSYFHHSNACPRTSSTLVKIQLYRATKPTKLADPHWAFYSHKLGSPTAELGCIYGALGVTRQILPTEKVV